MQFVQTNQEGSRCPAPGKPSTNLDTLPQGWFKAWLWRPLPTPEVSDSTWAEWEAARTEFMS